VSTDRRIGLTGVIVAFFGIAAFYLWPDKKWIGWTSLVIAGCLVLAWIVAETYRKSEGIDLWLGFDFNTWGPESSALCIQNRGKEPIFNVVVNIPEDGSILKSQPIDRLEADGEHVSCSVTKGQVRDAADTALVGTPLHGVVRDERGMVKEAKIPIRISYTDRLGKHRNWDGLEFALPFRDSAIKRRAK
jgi:hypothetical protein